MQHNASPATGENRDATGENRYRRRLMHTSEYKKGHVFVGDYKYGREYMEGRRQYEVYLPSSVLICSVLVFLILFCPHMFLPLLS